MRIDNNTLIIICNVIPAMTVLYFIFKGWLKGGLYMLISVVRLFGAYILTQILSRLLTNYLLSFPVVSNELMTFVLNNKESLNQIPGASLLLAGQVIENNIESITWWLLYFLSFIIIFILVMVVFSLLLRLAINFNKIPVLGFFNKFLGALEGLVVGLFITLILIYFISFISNLLGYYNIEQSLMASWLPVMFRTFF